MPRLLGVNLDHVATLRNARYTTYPDPIHALFIAEQSGADSITVHLREDRRHITERDVRLISQVIQTRLNLEMAATQGMLAIAIELKPFSCCLVPERRAELTTEGGLDLVEQRANIARSLDCLSTAGIQGSIFIDPKIEQIDAAIDIGATIIELNTGNYANSQTEDERKDTLACITNMANYAAERGLQVNAGHGLHYHNILPIAAIEQLHELNIGHAIIARALIHGLATAVIEMKNLIVSAA